jgi:hypothetical protein
VAQSGTLTGRTNAFADTHTMTYIFNYGNSFTNLSFEILDDPSGIISGISMPTATSGNGSSTQNFSVTFSSSVESIVYGSTATARIAATYVDNTSTQKIAYIDVVAKDEICCAYVLGSDDKCYRHSDSMGPRTAKPSCPQGWAVASGNTIMSAVSPSAWYAYAGLVGHWVESSLEDNCTFGVNKSIAWTVSCSMPQGSLVFIGCVQ